jgi:hypothetical protein
VGFLEACNAAFDWYSSCIFLDNLKRQAGCYIYAEYHHLQ